MLNAAPKIDDGSKLGDLSHKFPFTVFYQGQYDNIPSFGIIEMVKKNMNLVHEKMILRPFLYLLIETLQNIERYSAHKVSSEDCAMVYFDEHNFFIYTQNLVDNKKVDGLKQRLDSLQGKTKAELDKEYEKVMISDEQTEKGAGLGLIDLARKTHNRMFYDFSAFGETHSLYTICFAMPLTRGDLGHPPDFEEPRSVFRMLKKNFGTNESTLFYSGDFSNKFVHALLNFLKSSKEESEGSVNSKLHYILIELTQNIRRHAGKVDGRSQGQLTIEWNNRGISISTFNCVQEPNGSALRTKIAKLNASTPEQLKEYNRAVLTDFSTESGVGLIDVAQLIKGEKINCEILKKPGGSDELTIKLTFKNE